MKSIDPLQLQRLVDGELNDSEIQSVLGDADSIPHQWRDIAIGYIENQLWCKAFHSGEAADSNSLNSAKSAISAVITSEQAGASDTDRSPTPASALEKHLRSSASAGRPFGFSWLIMAASLLVAGTIGYMANQIANRTIPPTVADNVQPPSVDDSLPGPMIAQNSPSTNVPQPEITPISLKPDYHLEVPADSEPLRDMVSGGAPTSVPLFRIGNRDQLKQLNEKCNSDGLPLEVLRRLANSGYRMEQHIEFISGQLDDGQSFIVPVRTIRFVPGQ